MNTYIDPNSIVISDDSIRFNEHYANGSKRSACYRPADRDLKKWRIIQRLHHEMIDQITEEIEGSQYVE